ncbi:MAG TPA: type II toxin-antitoxin system RelE/ParE family toxin [Chloroflexota bacterium]|nr:type II toxin-antitoxin system RelE/ParE family toxin [Chloroflexota bacterium]
MSDLAVEQLRAMPAAPGRKMLDALQQLRTFPYSAPPVTLENYESYRQLIVRPYRAIYRYLEET